jgi:tetratricopeptide (TPR) repeat protein
MLPTSPEVQRTRIDAILKLAAVGTTRQDLERDQAHLEQARPLAEALHDTPRLGQALHNPFAEAAAYHYRGMLYDQYGDWPLALADYQEARRVAAHAGDLFRVYLVQFWEGRAATMAGDPARGHGLLEESLALASRLGTRFGLPCQKAFLAACLLALGEPAAALPLCYEAIGLAAETSDRLSNALAHRTLAEALSILNPANSQAAEHAIQEAIRLHEEIANRPELARSYVSYARLLQDWGETGKAKEHLERAGRLFRHLGMAWDLAQAEQALEQSV